MRRSGVYCIRNISNDKRYIGSSKDINVRIRVHRSRLRLNKHHSLHLQSAFNQSPDSFVFEIIEEIASADISALEQREQHWVDHYKTYDREFGYNAVKTVSRTDPARQRERWAKPGQREQQCERMRSICNTEHHRQRLSDGQKLRFTDPEERRRQIITNPLRKQVKCVETQQIFASINEAAKILGISVVTIRDNATGRRKSKRFNFIWVNDGKETTRN